ncbi:MAG: MipA/OmpV family protein, partial [Deltaproteobacteria bacterium]|nr:MipA/OmpV family protein [Deltaproteobacteria bacterium]
MALLKSCALTFTLFIAFTAIPCESYAQETRRLELGMGLAGASLPHYRGSDQRRDYFAPFPYVLYEGKRLKVNRDGGQFYFYDHPRFWIDVSAAMSPPVFSDDNHAREGMNDLHPVVELGPRVQVVLFKSKKGHFWLRASFPLRMAIASDLRDTRSVGFVFS